VFDSIFSKQCLNFLLAPFRQRQVDRPAFCIVDGHRQPDAFAGTLETVVPVTRNRTTALQGGERNGENGKQDQRQSGGGGWLPDRPAGDRHWTRGGRGEHARPDSCLRRRRRCGNVH
jgi:hypothetical protein